ncbi:MAG: hypothetical protein HY823_14475 [Acidobacteria bacterium]|nr:hypothetical protein [Acidobacteriota bacterium]
MAAMDEPRLLASLEDSGPLAVFEGFPREDLERLFGGWRLRWGLAAEGPEALYRIQRIPWSGPEEGAALPGAREGHLQWMPGEEDTLSGTGGRLRLAPGRPLARVAVDPACAEGGALGDLLGAALMHALALQGRLALHGMAALLGGTGVVALGDSQSGKSTLALACLRAGGRILTDDHLLVDPASRPPGLRALRRDLRLRGGSRSLVPSALAPLLQEEDPPGRCFLPRDAAPQAFLESLTPQRLLILAPDPRPSRLEVVPLEQARTLSGALRAASPLFHSGRYAAERAGLWPSLQALVEHLPSFLVALGPDLLADPEGVLAELLEQTAGGPGGPPAGSQSPQ